MEFVDNDGTIHDIQIEVKDCPFCGGPAKLSSIGNSHTKSRKIAIRCAISGCCKGFVIGTLRSDFSWCLGVALKAWNNRV